MLIVMQPRTSEDNIQKVIAFIKEKVNEYKNKTRALVN